MRQSILTFATLEALEREPGLFNDGLTRLQVANRTRVRRADDTTFIVRFYDVDIIGIHHDGTYTTIVDPNRPRASLNRIQRFVPARYWPIF